MSVRVGVMDGGSVVPSPRGSGKASRGTRGTSSPRAQQQQQQQQQAGTGGAASMFELQVQELRTVTADGLHTLSVRWYTSVKDVKDLLHKKLCVQPRFQELYYGTSKLSNSLTLHDLGIEESGRVLRLAVIGQGGNSYGCKSSTSSSSSSSSSAAQKGDTWYMIAPATGPGSTAQTPLSEVDQGCEDLLNEVMQGFKRGSKPISTDALDCTGGVYFLTDGENRKCAVFKPFDEEQGMLYNNKGYEGNGDVGLRPNFKPGQGCIRELAAYVMDHDNFAGVPETMLVHCEHKAFSYPVDERGRQKSSAMFPKLGSLQRFVYYQHTFDDIGTSCISDFEVQKIALLDMRLLNCDRNASNVLVLDRDANFLAGGLREHKYGRRYDRSSSITSSEDWTRSIKDDLFEQSESEEGGGVGGGGGGGGGGAAESQSDSDLDPSRPRSRRNTLDLANAVSSTRHHRLRASSVSSGGGGGGSGQSQQYILVPIDHGYTLPDVLQINEYDWVWFNMPQVRRPIDPEIKEYILGLDFEALALKLASQVAVSHESIFLLRLAHNLIVNGVKAGLTLYDIAKLIARMDDDVQSPLERAVAVAEENAHRAIEMRSGRLDSRSVPLPPPSPGHAKNRQHQQHQQQHQQHQQQQQLFGIDLSVGAGGSSFLSQTLQAAVTKPEHLTISTLASATTTTTTSASAAASASSPRSRISSGLSSPTSADSPQSHDSGGSWSDGRASLASSPTNFAFGGTAMHRRVNSSSNLRDGSSNTNTNTNSSSNVASPGSGAGSGSKGAKGGSAARSGADSGDTSSGNDSSENSEGSAHKRDALSSAAAAPVPAGSAPASFRSLSPEQSAGECSDFSVHSNPHSPEHPAPRPSPSPSPSPSAHLGDPMGFLANPLQGRSLQSLKSVDTYGLQLRGRAGPAGAGAGAGAGASAGAGAGAGAPPAGAPAAASFDVWKSAAMLSAGLPPKAPSASAFSAAAAALPPQPPPSQAGSLSLGKSSSRGSLSGESGEREKDASIVGAVPPFPSVVPANPKSPRRVVSEELESLVLASSSSSSSSSSASSSSSSKSGSEAQSQGRSSSTRSRPSSAASDRDKAGAESGARGTSPCPPPALSRTPSGRSLRRKSSKGSLGNSDWELRPESPARTYDADAECEVESDEAEAEAADDGAGLAFQAFRDSGGTDFSSESEGAGLDLDVASPAATASVAAGGLPSASASRLKAPAMLIDTSQLQPSGGPALSSRPADLRFSALSMMRVTSFSSFASEPIYDAETSERRFMKLNREKRRLHASKPEFRDLREKFAEQRLAVLLSRAIGQSK